MTDTYRRYGYSIWTWWIIRPAPFDRLANRLQANAALKIALRCALSTSQTAL